MTEMTDGLVTRRFARSQGCKAGVALQLSSRGLCGTLNWNVDENSFDLKSYNQNLMMKCLNSYLKLITALS